MAAMPWLVLSRGLCGENEFHQRIRALGVAHQFDISGKNIPVLKEIPGEDDAMAIEPWPVILPSTIASYQDYGALFKIPFMTYYTYLGLLRRNSS